MRATTSHLPQFLWEWPECEKPSGYLFTDLPNANKQMEQIEYFFNFSTVYIVVHKPSDDNKRSSLVWFLLIFFFDM